MKSIQTVALVATLGLGLALGTHANAEPKKRTYPSNMCEVGASKDYNAPWFSNVKGFAFGADGFLATDSALTVQCPIIKDNIGEALTRAFVWLTTSNTARSTLCLLESRRISSVGLSGTFSTLVESGKAGRLGSTRRVKREFRVSSVHDVSLPVGGPVDEPTVYNLRCQLAVGSAVAGYHVETDG